MRYRHGWMDGGHVSQSREGSEGLGLEGNFLRAAGRMLSRPRPLVPAPKGGWQQRRRDDTDRKHPRQNSVCQEWKHSRIPRRTNLAVSS